MHDEFDDDRDDDRDRDDHSPLELAGPTALADLADAFPPGPIDSTWFAEDLARKATMSLMRHKVEHVDRAVGRAMEQVPVPVGLAERLLSEMRLVEVRQCVGQQSVGQQSVGQQGVGQQGVGQQGVGWRRVGRRRVGRRRWLVSGMLAGAALAAGVFGLLLPAAQPLDYDAVIAGVCDFRDQEPAAEGKPLAAASPLLDDYLCPPAVKTNADTRWRPVHNLLGRAGLAYDLTTASGKRATLYVIDLNSRTRPIATTRLKMSPPPGSFTLGRTTGAWTDGTRLYVLVVEGGESDYDSFLRQQDSLA